MSTRCRPISGTRFLARYKADTDQEHQEVIEAGGLHIFGTERHEARRIDNQLRGRAGRQGDPGSSRFYLSLEDDLMRIFAKEWVSTLLQRLGMEEGVPIESRMITRRIEAAQKEVEGQNFEARKHLLEYDDVMNKQREAVYGLRRRLLEGLDQKDLIVEDYVSGILGDILERHCPPKEHVANWDLKALKDAVFTSFGVDIYAEGLKPESMNRQELGDAIFDKLKERYDAKEKLIGAEAMRYHERMIMLSVIDAQWKDHLLSMDHLKEGIGLRGYGQHDPLVEYKRESFDMFEEMMQRFQEETVRYLYLMQIMERPRDLEVRPRASEGRPTDLSGGDPMPECLPSSPAAGAATDARRAKSRPRWTKSKKPSSARKRKSWNKRAWPGPAICKCNRSCARGPKWGATILARAAAARNIRNAAGRIRSYHPRVAEEIKGNQIVSRGL